MQNAKTKMQNENPKLKIKKLRSFTLIEILVAATIFSFAVLGAFSIFFTTSSFQAKTRVTRDITQSARFFMEAVSREVRLADEMSVTNEGRLKIVNRDPLGDTTKVYRQSGDAILVQTKIGTGSSGQWESATTSDVKVDSLIFKNTVDDNSVTITVIIKQVRTTKPGEQGVITLKSTVYPRKYKQ